MISFNIYQSDIMKKQSKYGCDDYRNEMTLLNLKRLLSEKNLSSQERADIESLVRKLEKEMNLD